MFNILFKPEALSEVSRDIGQVFFASLAVGPLISGSMSVRVLAAGLLLSLIFWAISLLLAKA